ncbi:MAG: helix-turn-helix domain-containing protein [Chloroflexota bacterium]|nr:helix-turn-helix domain-containing protein [Chloroflexota bacterium]
MTTTTTRSAGGPGPTGRCADSSEGAADRRQERQAELGGSHFTYPSEIETNKRNPSVGVLRRIAAALGVPASRLVADAEA